MSETRYHKHNYYWSYITIDQVDSVHNLKCSCGDILSLDFIEALVGRFIEIKEIVSGISKDDYA